MNRSRNPYIRCTRNSSGSVAVEFALLLPVYIAFIFGIIEFGRMIWIRNTMEFAAEQAARYGAITTGATTATIEDKAKDPSYLIGVDPATVTFTATIAASNVKVVGTHSFTTLISAYVPIPATTLTVTATFAR
jgi:Flp pilus assembly protein TadG